MVFYPFCTIIHLIDPLTSVIFPVVFLGWICGWVLWPLIPIILDVNHVDLTTSCLWHLNSGQITIDLETEQEFEEGAFPGFNGVFSKCFHWIRWIQWQNNWKSKRKIAGLEPRISCLRDRDSTTQPQSHRQQSRALYWTQFMPQWFLRFPEFTEFSESFAPFRENSYVLPFFRRDFIFSVISWKHKKAQN